jgi:hypothetical protein
VPETSNFFSLLERIYVFISGSYVHRRWIQIQREMFPDYAPRELQRLSDTRWACRNYTCRNFRDRLSSILRPLLELEDDHNADRVVDERGLRAQIDGKFILLHEIFCVVLTETNTLSNLLQAPGLDLAAAVDLIQVIAVRVTELRSDDEFEKIWLSVTKLATACGIDPPKVKQKRASKMPQRLQTSVVMDTTGQRVDITDKSSFRTHVYFAILDCTTAEMNRRFSEVNCNIMTGIQSLNPQSSVFLQPEAIHDFAMAYESNIEDLKHELPQAKRLLERKKVSCSEPPRSLLELTCLLQPYQDAFHELYRLCQIAVTIPVSSAECERSFSALKRIKTYLRNSMSDSRLSNLGILSIESDRAKALNLSSFVDVFAAKHKNRKIKLY